jgi:hypothetical protein
LGGELQVALTKSEYQRARKRARKIPNLNLVEPEADGMTSSWASTLAKKRRRCSTENGRRKKRKLLLV